MDFSIPSFATPCVPYRPGAHIHQANLMEIRNLGEFFAPADVQNLSHFSTTTSGEEIAYNKLLGHQDGIIADIVRRAGMVRRNYKGILCSSSLG